MSFPERIKVTNLPFMFQGWNKIYVKIGNDEEGFPIYHLKPYTLYFFIEILGVKLFRKNGIWVIQRDIDSYPTVFQKYGIEPQSDPFGYWSEGCIVIPCD